MTNYTNTYACRIITMTQKRRATQFFRKIYLSLYLKGFERVTKGFTVRESWRPNRTATYWPPFLWPYQHFFQVLLGCLTGGPASMGHVPHSSIFSPIGLISNWLSFLCTELYNCSTPTSFLWASQIALIQPFHSQGYILIFLDRMHLLFTQVHFLFWQLGRGQ